MVIQIRRNLRQTPVKKKKKKKYAFMAHSNVIACCETTRALILQTSGYVRKIKKQIPAVRTKI